MMFIHYNLTKIYPKPPPRGVGGGLKSFVLKPYPRKSKVLIKPYGAPQGQGHTRDRGGGRAPCVRGQVGQCFPHGLGRFSESVTMIG